LYVDLLKGETHLSIYNMLGEELIQLNSQKDVSLGVDWLTEGFYLMKLTHSQGIHLMKFEKK